MLHSKWMNTQKKDCLNIQKFFLIWKIFYLSNIYNISDDLQNDLDRDLLKKDMYDNLT